MFGNNNDNSQDYSKPISFQSLVYRVVFTLGTSNHTVDRPRWFNSTNHALIAAFAVSSSAFLTGSLGPNVVEKDFSEVWLKEPKLFLLFLKTNDLGKLYSSTQKTAKNPIPHVISTTLQFCRFLSLKAADFDEFLLLILKETPYFARSLQRLTVEEPKTQRFIINAVSGMVRLEELIIHRFNTSTLKTMSRAFGGLCELPCLTSFCLPVGSPPLTPDFWRAMGDIGCKHEKHQGFAPLRKLAINGSCRSPAAHDSKAFQAQFVSRLCAKNMLNHLELNGLALTVDDMTELKNAKMTNLQTLHLERLSGSQGFNVAPLANPIDGTSIVAFIRSCCKNLHSLTLIFLTLSDAHLVELFRCDNSQGEDENSSFFCEPTSFTLHSTTVFVGSHATGRFIQDLSADGQNYKCLFFESVESLRLQILTDLPPKFYPSLSNFVNVRQLSCYGISVEDLDDSDSSAFLSTLSPTVESIHLNWGGKYRGDPQPQALRRKMVESALKFPKVSNLRHLNFGELPIADVQLTDPAFVAALAPQLESLSFERYDGLTKMGMLSLATHFPKLTKINMGGSAFNDGEFTEFFQAREDMIDGKEVNDAGSREQFEDISIFISPGYYTVTKMQYLKPPSQKQNNEAGQIRQREE